MKKTLIITITTILILLILTVPLFYFGYIQKESLPEGIKNLFPDGESIDNPNTQNEEDNEFPEQDTPTNQNKDIKEPGAFRFNQIFPGAVSGYTVFEKNGLDFIRFMEKETGHIYEYNTISQSLTKISNFTMPGVEEVLWNKDGSSFITRHHNKDTQSISTTFFSFEKKNNEDSLYNFSTERKLGDKGEDVFYIQKTLNENPGTQIAQTGAGSPGQETTYFGKKTQQALKIFQSQFGLEETGDLNTETISQINRTNKLLFETNDKDVTENPLTKKDLGDIESITIQNNEIFYMKKVGNLTQGFISNFNMSNSLRIFENPLNSFIVSWPNKNTITLQTKASGRALGYLYTLNPKTGVLNSILSDTYGLTTSFNSSGDRVFYSQTDQRGENIINSIYNTKTKEFLNLQTKTLAEKCVWGKSNINLIFCGAPEAQIKGTMPDGWYQGKVSFNDQFWMINTETKNDALLFENERVSRNLKIDAINLSVDSFEDTIYMINKKDLSLWSLNIGE